MRFLRNHHSVAVIILVGDAARFHTLDRIHGAAGLVVSGAE
jgi:hypothetical protein